MNKQQKSILVADDDVYLRETLCAILEGAGYRTGAAVTGAQALEKVVAGKFDVVLLDMIMSDGNSLAIIPALKRNSSGIRVIVMTGFPTPETAKDAIRKGANDFIAKPYREKEILMTIKMVLEEAAFEKSIEKSAFDQVLVAMSNPLRRGILKVLASHGKMQLFKLVEALGKPNTQRRCSI